MARFEITIIPALSDNYIYLLGDRTSNKAVVVDPSEAEPVVRELARLGYKLEAIWNTHHHPDHVGGNLELKAQTNCSVIGAERDRARIPGIDRTYGDNEIFHWQGRRIHTLATPGHTLGAICYWVPEEELVFTGDTLFSLGCGRLFEGTAEQMWQSLVRLRELPPHTRVYCGHEYTQANGEFARRVEPDNTPRERMLARVAQARQAGQASLPSLIRDERACNPFLRADTESLRQNLAMKDQPGWQVFKKIRELKDNA